MESRSVWELRLQGKGDVLSTVEVDTADDHAVATACVGTLRQVLRQFGEAPRHPRASVYVYEGPSVNFRRMTNSIFFAVAGRESLLRQAHAALAAVPGTDVRYGEGIPERNCLPCLHVEDGIVWEWDGGDDWTASTD